MSNIRCPGAPHKPSRSRLDPMDELERLVDDVYPFGIYPEHMDRLIRIGRDIVPMYEPSYDFLERLQEFEDYFEQWGVCSDVFWDFHSKCHAVVSDAPQDAAIEYASDDGELEVSS